MFKSIKKIGVRALSTVGLAAVLVAATGVTGDSKAQEAENLWSDVQKAGVLRCGAAVFPPYVMRDPVSGTYSGFFSDLCRQFGEEVLKVRVEFVDTTWDNIVAGLQANKWDLSIALNRTPQRAMAINFSDPATDYEVTIAYNKSNPKIPAGVKSLTELDRPDVKFAVVSGTAMDKSLSAAITQAEILRLPSIDEARLAIISRRADALADPSDSNWLFTQAHAEWATTMSPEPALSKQGVGFGLRRGVNPADIEALNIFIAEKRDTGAVAGLVKKAVDEVLAAQN